MSYTRRWHCVARSHTPYRTNGNHLPRVEQWLAFISHLTEHRAKLPTLEELRILTPFQWPVNEYVFRRWPPFRVLRPSLRTAALMTPPVLIDSNTNVCAFLRHSFTTSATLVLHSQTNRELGGRDSNEGLAFRKCYRGDRCSKTVEARRIRATTAQKLLLVSLPLCKIYGLS